MSGFYKPVAATRILDTISIPIEWPEDGAVPFSGPVLMSNGTYCRVRIRDASNAATQEVIINLRMPDDLVASSGIKFRPIGFITSATPPASTEGINFKGGGYSIGMGDAGEGALGALAEVEIADLHAAGCAAQYDIFDAGYSGTMAVTNLAAGEQAVISIIRDQADAVDDYAQPVGISEIIFQITRQPIAA